MAFCKIIPQGHCVVVERFGKPVRVAESGLRFFIPFLDTLKNVKPIWDTASNKNGIFIELTEQINDTMPRDCFTRDNVKLTVDCVYRYRIVDPIKAIYDVEKLHKSIKEMVLTEMRSFVGSNDLNFVLASRAKISEHIVATIADTVMRWGVNIVGADIQELTADKDTVDAMRMQLEASRRSESLKLEAEGRANAILKEAEATRQATVLRAQGECEAMQIVAQGEAEYLKCVSEIVGGESAARFLCLQKMLDSYKKVAADPAGKVFMPMPSFEAALVSENIKG